MENETQREMEKRLSVRLEKTMPVKFSLPQRRVCSALGKNISSGGLFIESDLVQDEGLSLDKDMPLKLEIELSAQRENIKPRGRIVWISRKQTVPGKQRNGFGIEFVQPNAQEKRMLSLFISKGMLAQAAPTEKEVPEILHEQKLTDKQHRNLEILDAIRKNRLISRAEISRNTNINIVTVSNYIDTYIRKGLVFERGLDVSTGGRRPELIELNPDYGYVIGVDFGPLSEGPALMQVAATDFTVRMKNKITKKRESHNIEDYLDSLKEIIAEVLLRNQHQIKKVKGIGLGISGIMDKFGGTVRNPSTGATFANYAALRKELEDEFGLPVFVENAANCALFAEKWSGINLEAKSADNIIYIFSENQCAIMLNGGLYTGFSRSAGQLNLAYPNNTSNSDYCWTQGSRDCVFYSGIGDLQKLLASKKDSSSAGKRLGAKIAYLVNIFNPQVVIINRSFSPLGDIFLDSIRRTVSRLAFREGANIVRIIPAALGDDAAALGAASLVIEAVFANI